MRRTSAVVTLALLLTLTAPLSADTTAHSLAVSNFSQDWTDASLISSSDVWSSVPSIVGYRGDSMTGGTAVDPQTVLAANDPGVIDVNANQTAPNTNTTGGVTEFAITNPVVAFQGSGTARAPYLQVYLDTTGRQTIAVSYNLRDIDGAADNSVQPVALHYRVGNSGAWTNVPAAFVADASTGPSLAALVTPVSLTLPAAVDNQPLVQLRIMTTDAVGSDEWIGVDDISVTSVAVPFALNINDVAVIEGAAGTSTASFTVSLTQPAGVGGVTFDIAAVNNTATTADNDYVANSVTGATIAEGGSTYTFDVTVNGDANPEPTETFFVNVTNIAGVPAGDTQGLGTITSDEAPPTLSIDNVTQVETNIGTTTFTFTVSLSTPAQSGGASFDIATADGTAQDDTPATEDSDYVAQSLTAQMIAAGNSSYTFNVVVNGDTAFEPNETYFVNVTNVTGASVTDGQGLGTITNDDTAPSFSVADIAAAEGDAATSTMTFTVTLSAAAGAQVTVDVATADSSATVVGSDYAAISTTTLTFAMGETTKTVDVTITGDTNAEGDEQFFVNLTNPTGSATIADNVALGIIRNDDPISIAAVDTPFTENFDGLAQVPAATTPVGWTYGETGSSTNLTYGAGTGSSNAGDTYSFGIAGTNPVTDRAFGGLQSGNLVPTIGALFRNDTGTTVTSLAIQYTGEQWRLGTAGRADRLDFQYSLNATSLTTGTWTHVDQLDFSTPNQASTGAKDGNATGNRTAVVFYIGSLSIDPGATFWIRFTDFNASGADDGLAVDDFSITANFAGAFLAIDDVTAFETNGATTFTFTVSLTQPAAAAGVTFDIATQDGTATTADTDYAGINLTGEMITSGNTSKTYNITVNGDATPEATETFFVNVTNIVNALPQDPQGLGTIIDDDTPITFIHDIQGSGSISPIVGSVVKIEGIVTGVKSNGFFVQEEGADADADPATSEGVFVFTSSAPPPAAAFESRVQVSGTVAEFVPSGDPQQPPVTELTSPGVLQVAGRQPLPAAVPLTATFPDPAGPFDQLERVEGMRVSIASVTVTGPSDGSFTESSATGTSNGRFHAVVTGVARPFREAGIQDPDVPSSGTIPPIPRWDFNPERLRIESATIGGAILTVKSGDVVAPIAGPLDYGFRGYAVYPDSTVAPVVTPGTLPAFVTAPLPSEVTVVSFNLQRFFDTIDDSGGDPILTATAYQNRLLKASVAIRDHLLFPDIIGVQEAEKLAVLQDLAAQISADALTNAQADPMYVGYLVEGNDIGGIDVGYLVKTAEVSLGVPRVSVISVTQEGKTFTWVDPKDNVTKALNDRPPLVLEATVNHPNGASFDVTVINNHLKSLIGVDSNVMDGLTTEGDRNRQKRQAQAAYLAALVQARQTADPAETIVLVGDFNAFEFNDGYGDVINTILGTPPPDNETVVAGDGIDFVNPDLVNLTSLQPAAERYSYSFDGNAQTLDHAIVNQALIGATTARRVERPRLGADYPETERNDNTTAFRLSDHDPVVAYFDVPSFVVADISIDDVTVTEGDAGTTTATFTVSLHRAAASTITVDWATSGNTATSGTDFTAASGTLTFTPTTTTQTLTVDVLGDLFDEANETYFVDLSNVTGPGSLLDAQGLGTITDDDGLPMIAIGDAIVVEGHAGAATPMNFSITLSNPSASTITVDAASASGTATSGIDFVANTQTLTFNPGVLAQTFTVVVSDDATIEGNETLFVNLSLANNALIVDGQGIGTIIDNDEALSAPDPTIISNCLPVIGGPCVLTAGSASGASQAGWTYTWLVDGVPSGSGSTFSPQFPGPGTYVIVLEVIGAGGQPGTATITITVEPPCPSGGLCLQGGRFEVSLVATDPRTGNTGVGIPLKENDQFGYFALPALTGSTDNPEVFVKILDGRPVNSNYWVFYGGLTDLQYTITVLDKETGEVKTYTKPGGSSAGGFDVGGGVTPETCAGEVDGMAGTPVAPGSCVAGSDRLCLVGGRFRIELTARDQRTGNTGAGASIPENDVFGYFALPGLTFDATNPEVFVKVLDGRAVNGHYWVFYAGLTDLEYTVTVTDVTTGILKSYAKAPGSACGGFDTNGF